MRHFFCTRINVRRQPRREMRRHTAAAAVTRRSSGGNGGSRNAVTYNISCTVEPHQRVWAETTVVAIKVVHFGSIVIKNVKSYSNPATCLLGTIHGLVDSLSSVRSLSLWPVAGLSFFSRSLQICCSPPLYPPPSISRLPPSGPRLSGGVYICAAMVSELRRG